MADSSKVKLSAEQLAKVKRVVGEDPLPVARRWKVHPDTLARALAGYAINRGTEAQIERALEKEAGG